MPCPLCGDAVLVSNALPSLLVNPATATDNQRYTLIPQRKVFYPGRLIEPIGTVCMPFFLTAKVIQLIQI